MTEKIIYLTLTGILLVLGYPVGGVLAKFGRTVSRNVGVVGIICFAAGYFFSVGTEDYRYRTLSACGLCLQVAWLVSSAKNKRALKSPSADLSASREN